MMFLNTTQSLKKCHPGYETETSVSETQLTRIRLKYIYLLCHTDINFVSFFIFFPCISQTDNVQADSLCRKCCVLFRSSFTPSVLLLTPTLNTSVILKIIESVLLSDGFHTDDY